jgi:hypothetical protein
MRTSIIIRESGTSGMLHYNEQEGWYTGGYCDERGGDCTDLHIHHIDPQRNGGGDTELNTICLYACEHVGVCKQNRIIPEVALHLEGKKQGKYVDPERAFVVHPDITRAFLGYDGTEDYFKKVFQERDERVLNGEYYWNTDHDEQFARTARERSQDAELISLGWSFPERKKK